MDRINYILDFKELKYTKSPQQAYTTYTTIHRINYLSRFKFQYEGVPAIFLDTFKFQSFKTVLILDTILNYLRGYGLSNL